jgi:aristolochene synthase
MALSLSPQDLELVRPIDRNCSKHLSIINDIWSYEKEELAAQTLHEEGGALCSGVSILAREAEVDTGAAKRVLYLLCREWELKHQGLVGELLSRRGGSPVLGTYVRGLELQMSGNELWSRTTLRYLVSNYLDTFVSRQQPVYSRFQQAAACRTGHVHFMA